MENTFNIIVIGSGPGGYTAAIKAAQMGYKTAIVEKYPTLGGTCVNVGCIPSKALLDSTEHYYEAAHTFAAHGIGLKDLSLDFAQFINRKADVVKQNTAGLEFLMKKNKIEVLRGVATFVSNTEIAVTPAGGGETLHVTSDYFIIATGSKPSAIPGVTIDKQRIITSTEALSLPDKPASMIVIGGGVIGSELGSVFSRIGAQISIVEYADSLISNMDKELGKELKRLLNKEGINVFLSSKVQSATNNGSNVTVTFIDSNNETKQLTADYCLVAVGRHAYTAGLGLEKTKVEVDERGRIKNDDRLQTAEPNIYAIGDAIKGAMLAHKAEDEAIVAVENIKGGSKKIHYDRIPSVVYTWPEIASVGLTEEQLTAAGTPYRVGKFPFSASGRARAAGEKQGFVKVLSDPQYGEVLGVHVVGPRAADLIAMGVYAMEFELTAAELGHISYAHPTYSEAFKDAMLESSGGQALNK
jgi:dihydrolipoamide dehydrogenase